MDEPQSATPVVPIVAPSAARRLLLIVPLTAICVAGDLLSKSAIFDRLGFPHGEGPTYRWLGRFSTFRLFTSFNEGALWGFGQGLTWLFSALSFVAVTAIVFVMFRTTIASSRWVLVALCLVLSGTLGNLYDRLGIYGYRNPETGEFYHAVRDFLLFTFGTYSWPIFNFADVFLVTGTSMLVAYSFWTESHTSKLQSQAHRECEAPAGPCC